MNYRLNSTAIAIVSVLVLLALGLFGYLAFTGKEATVEPLQDDQTEQTIGDARIITAKHDYIDGKHVVAGTVDMPTPCERLTTDVFFTEGSKDSVELQFKTINESEEPCEQTVTPQRFKVEFEGPEKASISATLDGTGVVLNLVEVPEGEDLESFEEYIKG